VSWCTLEKRKYITTYVGRQIRERITIETVGEIFIMMGIKKQIYKLKRAMESP
jgi:hypothetical protein